MNAERAIEEFEAARAQLIGIAYRILGSLSDAEDAVQDTYIKWADADIESVRNPTAWLTTVCTRRCIDILRKRQRSQTDYVGNWLPEPIQTASNATPESQAELASSLNTAFMMVLERLTPKERAGFLLREVFDIDYADIAETLGATEAACRKLVSRAINHVGEAQIKQHMPIEQQDRMLRAFQSAVETGEITPLKKLLSADVKLQADGGGKVPTLIKTLEGPAAVSRFIGEGLKVFWADIDWVQADMNGQRGLLTHVDGEITGAITFGYDTNDHIKGIYIVRSPDKLAALYPININLFSLGVA